MTIGFVRNYFQEKRHLRPEIHSPSQSIPTAMIGAQSTFCLGNYNYLLVDPANIAANQPTVVALLHVALGWCVHECKTIVWRGNI